MKSVAAKKVEGNNDILMSILVRLPPKSVFRFRWVSNRWNNIIVGSDFLRSYSTATRRDHLRGARLLASLQLTPSDISVRRFMSFLDDNNIELVPNELSKLIISSNGLILCGDSSNTYHVWNPITKKSVSLPPREINPERTYEGTFVGFVCEENTNELVPKTGMWAKSTLFGTGFFYLTMDQPPPLVFNGLIKLPLPGDGRCIDSSFTRSKDDDVLWFVVTDFDHGMRFWMLPKNEDGSYMRSTTIPADEWRLMHTITAASLLNELGIPLMLENDDHLDSVWLEGLIPYACSAVVVVIRVGERVYLYNLETQSIELLQYDDGNYPTKWWYPYMESLYLSSYAL
ncbi:hypothetical protein ACJIZ3_003321 [Penstemon smallii]|uniref:F-box domain-containing protein n=1 Tax=Penstemon smallii TaxID=265156 RepID=A0ABD3UBJ7_9LAMI